MPESTGVGVYVQGTAYELSEKDDVTVARNITQNRKGKKASEGEYVRFTGDSIRRIYKVVPEKMWINDVELDEDGRYIKDIRIELPLMDLKKLIRV